METRTELIAALSKMNLNASTLGELLNESGHDADLHKELVMSMPASATEKLLERKKLMLNRDQLIDRVVQISEITAQIHAYLFEHGCAISTKDDSGRNLSDYMKMIEKYSSVDREGVPQS